MPAALRSRIPEIIAELPHRMGVVEEVTAEAVAADARARAPRLRTAIVYPSFQRYPGELADSIEPATSGTSGGIVIGAEYWRYVEYGTQHMRAEPYLGPAVDYGEAGLMAATEAALQEL